MGVNASLCSVVATTTTAVTGTYLRIAGLLPGSMTDATGEPLAGVDHTDLSVEGVATDEVRAALSHPDPLVRQRGCKVCTALAVEDPAAIRPLVDDLAALLCDDNAVVVKFAATALLPLAEASPGALADAGAVGDVVALADSDLPEHRSYAAKILAAVTRERSGAVAPHVDGVVAALRRDSSALDDAADLPADDREGREAVERHRRGDALADVEAREVFANVVAAAAEHDPAAVVEAVEGLRSLLDDDAATVVDATLAALSAVAADEDTPRPAVLDETVDCLDHPDESVRARAIEVLGYLGDPAAVTPLRTVASGDADDDVRALAAETVDFFEAQ